MKPEFVILGVLLSILSGLCVVFILAAVMRSSQISRKQEPNEERARQTRKAVWTDFVRQCRYLDQEPRRSERTARPR